MDICSHSHAAEIVHAEGFARCPMCALMKEFRHLEQTNFELRQTLEVLEERISNEL